MSFNPYFVLARRRRSSGNEERMMNNEGETIERTKKLSCWHILSVATAVVSMVLASMLLVTNVTYYINDDHMVEQCTSEEVKDDFYPCHYLEMIVGQLLKNGGAVTSDDFRLALHVAYLFTIVLASHFLLATMVLMLGVATNKHLALIPRMIVQFLVALVFTGLVMLELYVDHCHMKDEESNPAANRSRYFMVAVASLAYVVVSWAVDCVTYLRIKKVNMAIGEMRQQADFSYARFGTGAAAVQ